MSAPVAGPSGSLRLSVSVRAPTGLAVWVLQGMGWHNGYRLPRPALRAPFAFRCPSERPLNSRRMQSTGLHANLTLKQQWACLSDEHHGSAATKSLRIRNANPCLILECWKIVEATRCLRPVAVGLAHEISPIRQATCSPTLRAERARLEFHSSQPRPPQRSWHSNSVLASRANTTLSGHEVASS